jgi:hypothetical protein
MNELMFLNENMKSKFLAEKKTRYRLCRKLEYAVVQNGICVPLKQNLKKFKNNILGGVFDINFKFCKMSSTQRSNPPNFIFNYRDWFDGKIEEKDKKNIVYKDKEVIFLGAFSNHYGHFMLEGMSRLWILLSKKYKDFDLIYISENDVSKYFEFLELFGVNLSRLTKVTNTTQYRKIIVPEQSIRLHDYYHKDYFRIIDKISSKVDKGKIKKVYFTKNHIKNGRAFNERHFEDIFKKNDFKIIDPVKITIIEMISTLKGADFFVSTSGTSCHNAMFLNKNAKCICLNRSAHFHPPQSWIAEMKIYNTIYVDAFMFERNETMSSGPYFLTTTKEFLNFGRTFKIKTKNSKLNILALFKFFIYLVKRKITDQLLCLFFR